MQGKNDGCGRDNGQAGLNCLNIVAEAWAASLQVFLHRRFGERYLGLQAACVVLLIPLYCVLWVPADPRPMMLFLLAFLFMCVKARARHSSQPDKGGAASPFPLLRLSALDEVPSLGVGTHGQEVHRTAGGHSGGLLHAAIQSAAGALLDDRGHLHSLVYEFRRSSGAERRHRHARRGDRAGADCGSFPQHAGRRFLIGKEKTHGLN